LQSLAEEDFQSNLDAGLEAGLPPGKSPQGPRTAQTRNYADRAASAGFVLSMIFLASAAIYGFSLSDEVGSIAAEAAAIADRAALDAGFKLENLALTGVKNAPQAAILDALGLPYRGSSLSYRTARAQDELLKLGWLETASVRRILPSRLEVSVVEREPFARWERPGGTVTVIDARGRLLGPDEDGRFGSLLLFAGEGAADSASEFEDAIGAYATLRARIKRAELVAARFWSVKLESGLMLKLPHKVTPLVLNRLDSLLGNQKVAEMGLETIDLRLSNRTILQLRDASLSNRDRAIAFLSSGEAQGAMAQRKGKAL
jgi:cell division protein FtsQ